MIYVLDTSERIVATLGDGGQSSLSYWHDRHRENLYDVLSTYEFETDSSHPNSLFLVAENFIARKDFDNNIILFKIKRVEENQSEGKYIKKVYCENAATSELLTDIIRPRILSGYTASQTLDYILNGSQWEKGEVSFVGAETIEFKDYETALQGLHILKKKFSAEFYFTIEMKNNRIYKRYVHFIERRGNRTGKRFEYERDIQGLRRIEDSSELVTALIALGPEKDGKRMTIQPVNNGIDWIGDEEARDRWSHSGKHLFGVFESDNATSPSSLKDQALKELERRKKPLYSYEVDVVLLEHVAGYAHKSVRLGDGLDTIDRAITPEIYLSSRIIELIRSYTDPTQDSCILGEHIPQFISIPSKISELQQNLRNKAKENIIETARRIGTHFRIRTPRSEDAGDFHNDVKGYGIHLRVNEPIHLGTTMLISNSDNVSGNIVLYSKDTDSIIAKRSVLLSKGSNQIDLDLQIPDKGDYWLGVDGGWIGGMVKRFEIKNTSYPIDAGSMKVIGSGQRNEENDNDHYYYFADITAKAPNIVGDLPDSFTLPGENISGSIQVTNDHKIVVINSDGNRVMDANSDDLGVRKIIAGEIVSSSVVSASKKNKTIHIHCSDGSDETGDGTSEKPFRSIQTVIDALSKYNEGFVELKISGTSTTEDLSLYGFFGPGVIRLDFPSSFELMGTLTVLNCTSEVNIFNLTVNRKPSEFTTPVLVSRSLYVYFKYLKTYSDYEAKYGIHMNDNSMVFLHKCQFWGAKEYAILAGYASQIVVIDAIGGSLGSNKPDDEKRPDCSVGAFFGATISIDGTIPVGKVLTRTGNSGEIRNAPSSGSAGGTEIPTPPPQTVKEYTDTFSSTSSKSWRTKYGWRSDNSYVYQGSYGYGNHMGLWFFNDASIRSTLSSSKEITSIRLRVSRRSEGGNSSSNTPTFRTHNYSSPPKGEPDLSSSTSPTGFKWGDDKWVTLPTSWGASLRDGDAKGIAIFEKDGSPYMIFNGSATLEIKYKK
ncbi:phage tail spike protein [Thermoactinomyces sp. DSM 45892]|uniref:phage tail spike protein n=1 Tax=Thermoactinomyces sp. DSM 45892 TaxID=1882753 RepID=UPI00089503F5|nr:phage tail spike protein [Thermoactinomyces sp. DSM 45892]SDZ05330.1 phage minor structural protein, N-terminal region [Thermoactinomyces sp. DSM 45892]